MKKEPQIFTSPQAQGVPVPPAMLKSLEQDSMGSITEQWRKFNEATEPVLGRAEIENLITDKFSFNSAQTSQHRWSPRQPIIDYSFDKHLGNWKYTATFPDGSNDAAGWATTSSDKDENIEDFLTRVKETPHQFDLGLE
jgi:hypothetical protein